MFQNLKIRTRLLAGFSVIVFLVFCSGLIGVMATQKAAGVFHKVIHENAPALQALLEIKSAANEIEAQTLSFELLQLESTLSEDTTGGEKKFGLLARIEKIETWTQRYEQYEFESKTKSENYALKINEIKDRVVVAALEFIRLKEQGRVGGELIRQKEKLENARQQLKNIVESAVDDAVQEFHDQQALADQAVSNAVTLGILSTVMAFMFAWIIGFVLSNSIARPIAQLRKTAQAIATGDLSRRSQVLSRDEIGDLAKGFNAMANQIEKEIQKRIFEEEKFRLVFESAPYGMVTVNELGKMLLMNSTLERMFGYQREELYEKEIEILVPKRHRANHVKDRASYFQAPSARAMGRNLNLTGRHKDGREFPVDISLNPMHTAEGLTVLATVTDLTERKRLEQIVRQSEKMSAIGQLAGGVAHEINNPLGVILGFAQGVARRIQPGDPFEMAVKSIEREAIRCKQLVQDLLTFSRVSKIEKERINLNQAVEGALSLVLAQSKVKSVKLIKDLKEGLPPISANGGQVQQIVVNLCNNAIDAMPQGGTLTVCTASVEQDGGKYVQIVVEDKGQGIPSEILPQIFNPFFTTKEIGKGTGLGLSLVYEIVQKHNGEIKVESQIGKGTIFKVFLPLFNS